ncbi:unnamed protein product [Rangifer tarandus platyrhynchus]|uniref:Uncharacterized protein n=2 Tax=Rangifer tarandus platyrhynchus TaxID=3082113 RepID=A0ABN8ZDI3_RANTA|nr:unnamed protein product [Rangifer tarandus platyrhynchus]
MKGRLAEMQHRFLWELAPSPRELSRPDPGGYLRRVMDLEPCRPRFSWQHHREQVPEDLCAAKTSLFCLRASTWGVRPVGQCAKYTNGKAPRPGSFRTGGRVEGQASRADVPGPGLVPLLSLCPALCREPVGAKVSLLFDRLNQMKAVHLQHP